MPRYYFDIDDGEHRTYDETGHEFIGREAAREQAIAVLPNIARDMLLNGDRRDFVSYVRDETGNLIFTATLSLTARWLD